MMRENRRALIVWGVVALILAALIYAWRQTQWIEVQLETGLEEAARQDAFLAAKQFLAGYGIEHRELGMDDFLSDSAEAHSGLEDALLFLPDGGRGINAETEEALMAWVRQGGHLVIAPDIRATDRFGPGDAEDIWLQRYAVSVQQETDSLYTLSDLATLQRGLQSQSGSWVSTCEELPVQVGTTMRETDELLALNFLTATYFLWSEALEPSGQAGDEYPRLLQYDEEEGLVTLLVSADLWKNQAIACLDHAYLLRELQANRGTFAIWQRVVPTGQWSDFLDQHGFSLTLALLALVAALWALGQRFGPVRGASASFSLSAAEYYEANAAFVRNRSGLSGLLQNLGIRDIPDNPSERQYIDLIQQHERSASDGSRSAEKPHE